ncbi:MAG: uracil-xanthine permease family protein [Opitutales bacterium]
MAETSSSSDPNPPAQQELIYRLNERPKTVWETIFYGYQHTMVDISPFIVPLGVASAIGMTVSESSYFINLCLFAMGIATLLQTTIGNRLPIVQGPSVILIGVVASIGQKLGAAVMWGAIFVGGLLEMLLGASGLLRYLQKLFPPAVSGVVVICIGISLGQVAVMLAVRDGTASHFMYSGLVMCMIFVLQIRFPNALNGLVARGSILFSMFFVGAVVAGFAGDVNWDLVKEKPWFSIPSLFPYGGPGFGWEFVVAAILTCLAGYLGSVFESLGDYAATCAACDEPYTAKVMNRGIFAEGLGSMVAAMFGGLPCTSFTQNIGIIATTRVASRVVVQVSAVVFILYGICPKFGALLVAMPGAVLGGVFLVICGMITITGMRLVSMAESTTVNQMVIGLTLVISLGLPFYIKQSLPAEWAESLPTLLNLIVTNSVVLVVVVGMTLNILLRYVLKPKETK